MKKFIKIIAIIIALSCFSLLFACNKAEKPQLDLSEARDNLNDREYFVIYERASEDDMYGLLVSSLSAYHTTTEDYIEILAFNSKKLAKATYKMLKSEQEVEIKNKQEEIKWLEQILKLCSDEMESAEIDEIEDAIKDIKKEIREIEKEIIGYSTYYVWVGTIGAIEDTH